MLGSLLLTTKPPFQTNTTSHRLLLLDKNDPMNPGSQVVVTTDGHINDDGFTTVIRRQKKNKAGTIKGQPVNISSNQVRGFE